MEKLKDVIYCHDCKKAIKEGEEVKVYRDQYYKCLKCFDADPVLRNFQDTEVYARIVGYIRPIEQFNPGKVAEVKERKMFVFKKK
jgi:anaerobic ribonucleoside-triphosphate reductase